jgi:RimJ/RimL family protein N-acetyltransferase
VVSRAEQRGVLRRLVSEDRDGFVEMNRDLRVRKYFPGLLTPEESYGEMTRIEQHWDTHGFGPWVLDFRGDFAGILGLKWVPPDMPFAPAVELLYRLIPRFWGQGLATEGSLAALEFGFCELHLDTVVAFAVEANTGSRRVMEKVGMVRGRDFDHPSIPELSALRRHVLYSLTRADWHEKSSPIQILA